MASFTFFRHLGWRMQAAWTNITALVPCLRNIGISINYWQWNYCPFYLLWKQLSFWDKLSFVLLCNLIGLLNEDMFVLIDVQYLLVGKKIKVRKHPNFGYSPPLGKVLMDLVSCYFIYPCLVLDFLHFLWIQCV